MTACFLHTKYCIVLLCAFDKHNLCVLSLSLSLFDRDLQVSCGCQPLQEVPFCTHSGVRQVWCISQNLSCHIEIRTTTWTLSHSNTLSSWANKIILHQSATDINAKQRNIWDDSYSKYCSMTVWRNTWWLPATFKTSLLKCLLNI